jgi:O-antigen ligase
MYFIPENLKTWIIGDGMYTTDTGSPYMLTDPFYMRALLFFGIPGIMLYLSFLFIVIRRLMVRLLKDNEEDIGRSYIRLLIFVLVVNLVTLLKLDAQSFWLLFYLSWCEYFYDIDQIKINQYKCNDQCKGRV